MKALKALAASVFLCSLGLGLPTSPAMAQTIGDHKCSPDGYVMTYYTNGWRTSMIARCDSSPNSSPGISRGQGNNMPQDGDTKCGADGKVYTYSGSMRRWNGSLQDCR
jgi:hypothetical protein